MLQSQLQLLQTCDKKYLSIGVTADGAVRQSISIPWKHTCHAFNMRTPDVFVSPADLEDPDISALLERHIIRGCYIFDPLEDYSFLGRFPALWDVSILHGDFIRDLSFLEGLRELTMFYIEDARILSLAPLFPADAAKSRCEPYCMGFCSCQIGDISPFEQAHVHLSELVVIQPRGANEKNRWRNVSASTYSYYEFK